MSNYVKALEAAGAEVLAYEEFGSYQGTWFAKVKYNDVVGWVTDHFGSCSGCDHFYDQVGYEPWDEADSPAYQEKVKTFGREYLDQILTTEKALEKASEHIEWDLEAQQMVDFIKGNSENVE